MAEEEAKEVVHLVMEEVVQVMVEVLEDLVAKVEAVVIVAYLTVFLEGN